MYIDLERARLLASAAATRDIGPYVVHGGEVLLADSPIERSGFWLFTKHPNLVLTEMGMINADMAYVVT